MKVFLQFLKIQVLVLLFMIPLKSWSQELNCNVQISAQRIQGSNRQVFETMQRDIYEFMNNTVWTNLSWIPGKIFSVKTQNGYSFIAGFYDG